MLLVLMYHQVFNPKDHQSLELFKEHLNYLNDNFPIILPGEPLVNNNVNICLTFDDAYSDFYHYVFPILKQKKIAAVLGIPTDFIQNTTNQNNNFFCTWPEIKEMVASKYVKPASHTCTHADLTKKNIDLLFEIQTSKEKLYEILKTSIDTFIYPFGKTTKHIHTLTHAHYKYCMRIGSAINKNWYNHNGLIYRINADPIWQQKQHITSKLLIKTKFKYYLNYIRKK